MREVFVGFLHDHRESRTELLADRLTETIEEQNPGYRQARIISHQDLLQSCHDNIGRVLELLSSRISGEREESTSEWVFDAARATGRRRAEQGLPLDDVLRSFRLGGRLIWEDLIGEGSQALRHDEIREIGTSLWKVVDETSAQVAASYHAHERANLRLDEQRRAALWERLLSARGRDPGFANEAARVLDLPADGDYVVLVAAQLDLAAGGISDRYAIAWAHRTGGAVGLIALGEDRPDDLWPHLAGLAEGAPIGVSAVVHGLTQVQMGLTQATLALRGLDAAHGLAVFDRRLPEALLASAPDVACRLVEVWVGPLLAVPGDESAVLLETAYAWVAAGGSATRTAAGAHCHRNTVLNRLRRIGELIDVDLRQEAVPIELDLALRAHRLGLDQAR